MDVKVIEDDEDLDAIVPYGPSRAMPPIKQGTMGPHFARVSTRPLGGYAQGRGGIAWGYSANTPTKKP